MVKKLRSIILLLSLFTMVAWGESEIDVVKQSDDSLKAALLKVENDRFEAERQAKQIELEVEKRRLKNKAQQKLKD